MESQPNQDNNNNNNSHSKVLKVLEALKQASQELQHHNSAESNSSAIDALLDLETESDSLLSRDPHLSTLSHHLSALKSLVASLRSTTPHRHRHRHRHGGLRAFLARRASTQSLSRLAGSIESEIQAWIDRESLETLTKSLKNPTTEDNEEEEDELIKLLTQFEDRVLQGFDRELQDLLLQTKVFNLLERCLCFTEDTNSSSNSKFSTRVREHCAFAIAALIKFNKDVFVGQVLMDPTIKALIKMASLNSMRVLCTLIRLIKSPLVDEIEFNGQIPKIISLLKLKKNCEENSNEFRVELRVMAFVCVLEMGYFGRKESIDAMLEEGLVEKLVELQRSELGGDYLMGMCDNNCDRDMKEEEVWEMRPFASCVARFSVQLEVGEGLRRSERREFKQKIIVRVREASVSDAEAASIIAEVLWGASP